MGRKLTEGQKAKRAADADVRKQRAELGPLFRHQAERPDEHTLMMSRRRGHAKNVEHLQQLMDGMYLLDRLTELAAERAALAALGADEFTWRLAIRREKYPPQPTYGILYWRKFGVDVEMWSACGRCHAWHEPGQEECSYDRTV